MEKKQLKELLETIELAEGRARAIKIQLKMLETHLEALREKLRHIAKDKNHERV